MKAAKNRKPGCQRQTLCKRRSGQAASSGKRLASSETGAKDHQPVSVAWAIWYRSTSASCGAAPIPGSSHRMI